MINNSNNLDVMILVGGLGTRLNGIVDDRPKPMADFNGAPFLNILLQYLSSYGFWRFILCLGHMADVIRDYYKVRTDLGEFVFSTEQEPLGTGGAIKNAIDYIRSDTFLVLNGDSFCPLNLTEFTACHRNKNAMATIAVTEVENAGDYGSIKMDASHNIISFNEKRSCENGLVNAGLCFFEKKIVSLFPEKRKFSLEMDLFPAIVGKGFYGYFTNEPVIDIGTPERLINARNVLSESINRINKR